MTSWHKRITNVKTVLETLLKQTVPPTRIILSLCIQNFPRMTKDLPEDLLEFLDEHKDLIELFWFLEDYKDSDKKYPFDLIYDSIKDHFESGEFGKIFIFWIR